MFDQHADCRLSRQTSSSTEVESGAELGNASSDGGVARAESERGEAVDALTPPGGPGGEEYASCFWVPPTPKGMRRIYHNRKRTAYTELPVDGAGALPVDKTLIRLLESESNPSPSQVKKAAFLEGHASEDSNLLDVLHGTRANGWQPLLIAAQRKQAAAVSALLELNASVDCREPCSGWTPLMYAVANGDEPTVKTLLKHGASVNSFAKPSDWNALSVAIMSDRSCLVPILLEAGAEPDLIRRRHPCLADVYAAEASGCLPCVRTSKQCRARSLLACEGARQRDGESGTHRGDLLIRAIRSGQKNSLDKLLEEGIDIECRDSCSGWTPLMHAVAIGNLPIIRRLLEHGASPNTVAWPCCWNALVVALLESSWEVVSLLLDYGADVRAAQCHCRDHAQGCYEEIKDRLWTAKQLRVH